MRRKFTFRLCLAVLCLLLSIGVRGQTPVGTMIDGQLKYDLYDDGTASVGAASYEGPNGGMSGDVVIPATVEWEQKSYSVTTVINRAFYCWQKLSSITLPDGITSIGNYAFSACTGLSSITLPDGVTNIGDNAFSSCFRLSSITLPDGITSIGNYAFSSCSSLSSITLPDGITSIGDHAFSKCTSLVSLTLPESVISIGDGSFEGCSSLSSITLPDNLKSVGADFLNGTVWYDQQADGVVYCGPLLYGYKGTMPADTFIEIKEGTTIIALGAFLNCSSLSSITLPEGITSIAPGTFSGCSSLSSITLPDGITSIGSSAFSSCSSLSSIILPDGITSIGSHAFSDCGSLSSLTLPDGIASIEFRTFSGCYNLATIVIPESVTLIAPNALSDTQWYDNQPDGLVYAGSTLYAYKGVMPENTALTIKDGIVSITENTFRNCSNLISLAIPNTLDSIGDYVFNKTGAIRTIYAFGSTPPSVAENTFDRIGPYYGELEYAFPYDQCTLYVPFGAASSYAEAASWSNFKHVEERLLENNVIGCFVSVSQNREWGTIYVNDKVNKKDCLEPGIKVSFKIVPDENAYIQQVMLNDRDITNKLINNVYTINALDEDLNLVVTFGKECSVTTDYDKDLGSVKINNEEVSPYVVKSGTQVDFSILPNAGCETQQVFLDGIDITADLENNAFYTATVMDDMVLKAVFVNPSSLSGTDGNEVKVYSSGGRLLLEGLTDKDEVIVTNVAGQVIYKGTATAIPMNEGLYLVRVGNEVTKVWVR